MKRRHLLLGGGTIAAIIGGVAFTNPLSNQTTQQTQITAQDTDTEIEVTGHGIPPSNLLLTTNDFDTDLLPSENKETLVNDEIPVLMPGRKGILVETTHTTINNEILLTQRIGTFENNDRAREDYRGIAQRLTSDDNVITLPVSIGEQTTGGVHQVDTNIGEIIFRDQNITVNVTYSNGNNSNDNNEKILNETESYATKIHEKIQQNTN